MVHICAVVGCSNRSGRDNKRFFNLPAIITREGEQTKELSEKRQRAWLAALSMVDLKPRSYGYNRVCEDHFISGQSAKLYDCTNPDWVPSLNMGHIIKQTPPPSRVSRYERTLQWSDMKKQWTAARALLEFHQQTTDDDDLPIDTEIITKDHRSISTQTDMCGTDISVLEKKADQLGAKVQKLDEELQSTKQRLQNFIISPSSFEDDAKVKFFLLDFPTS